MDSMIEAMRNGLIVSCQAHEGEPLHGPALMATMAYAAEQGGAVGIRACGEQDIAFIRRVVNLPVIGIIKVRDGNNKVWVTPTIALARTAVRAGAHVVAVDARVNRVFGDPLAQIVSTCHQELGVAVMADCASLEDALWAEKAGADLVATTFVPAENGPDFDVLRAIIDAVSCPIVAEGGYWCPEQAALALELGAFAVVVGTAITRPREITRRFVSGMSRALRGGEIPRGQT